MSFHCKNLERLFYLAQFNKTYYLCKMENIIIGIHCNIYLFPFKKQGSVMDINYDYEELEYVKYVWLIFSIIIYKSIKS